MQSNNNLNASVTDGYPILLGLVYIFNLIVGTGALALPRAFSEAGYVLGGIAIGLLAAVSLLTATFVLEAMSIANALKRLDVLQGDAIGQMDLQPASPGVESADILNEDIDEQTSLLHKEDELPSNSLFSIIQCIELGEMASMFFNKLGVILFYLAMCIYLFGDLSIYAATIPKSMQRVVCSFGNQSTVPLDSMPCWPDSPVASQLTHMDAYRIFLAAFIMLVGPLLFFDLKKTAALQLLTSILRWLSFIFMLVYSSIRLTSNDSRHGHPAPAKFSSLPNLFGVCVYAFMCHHSLPSLVTPIRNKKRMFLSLLLTYSAILVFYLCLAYTGIAAFEELQDIYTLNFFGPDSELVPAPVSYFLALFPVFTLSASFPIIGVTLRNNLRVLVTHLLEPRWTLPPLAVRVLFPLMALLPPTAIAMATNDVTSLVGYTGSYGGLLVQYVIPVALVWCARRERDVRLPALRVLHSGCSLSYYLCYQECWHVHYWIEEVSGNSVWQESEAEESREEMDEAVAQGAQVVSSGGYLRQMHRSPCSSWLWIIIVIIWSLLMVVFVTVDHVMDAWDNDQSMVNISDAADYK